jgi:hypothetical protein
MASQPRKPLIVEDEPATARELSRLPRDRFPDSIIDPGPTQAAAVAAIDRRSAAGEACDLALIDIQATVLRGEARRPNANVYRKVRATMPDSLVIHTTAYPDDPEVTRYILNETMRSPLGPRSVLLPLVDASWPQEILQVVDQVQRQASPGRDGDDRRPPRSCFISHPQPDEEFATRLYTSLKDQGVDAWFAPARMRPGVKIHEEIEKDVRPARGQDVTRRPGLQDAPRGRVGTGLARALRWARRACIAFLCRLPDDLDAAGEFAGDADGPVGACGERGREVLGGRPPRVATEVGSNEARPARSRRRWRA